MASPSITNRYGSRPITQNNPQVELISKEAKDREIARVKKLEQQKAILSDKHITV